MSECVCVVGVHFKWCKGCKKFLCLYCFADRVVGGGDALLRSNYNNNNYNKHPSKCDRCRERGRQSYKLKKGQQQQQQQQLTQRNTTAASAATTTTAATTATTATTEAATGVVVSEGNNRSGRRGKRTTATTATVGVDAITTVAM